MQTQQRSDRWRPIRIGVFYYATNGPTLSRANFMLREACERHCARLNA
jgi:hypothetical protein